MSHGPCLCVQDAHLQTITEVLQSIKASEMTPLLNRIYGSQGGSELLDVLMKYLYGSSATCRRPVSQAGC